MHPNFLKLMIVKRLIFTFVLVLGSTVFYFFQLQVLFTFFWLLVLYGVVVLLGLVLLILAKAFFKRKKYKIADKNISYQEGILYQKETVVPFARIQHIEIDEGPLERYFKIATLSIYTAGDSGRDLKINGLELTKAQEIKSFISNFIKDE